MKKDSSMADISPNNQEDNVANDTNKNVNTQTDSANAINKTSAPIETITEKKKVKSVKQIKNVSVKQCFGTIFFSLFALCVALIPITFGNTGINMTFKALPIIGDGSIAVAQTNSANGIVVLFKLSESLSETFASLLNIATLAFYGILLANIVFALFLVITRLQKIRIIFKIYSILAGFAMIFILAMSLVHIIGFFGLIIQGIIPIESVMTAIETSAILTAIGTAIISALLIGKQFRWFARLY